MIKYVYLVKRTGGGSDSVVCAAPTRGDADLIAEDFSKHSGTLHTVVGVPVRNHSDVRTASILTLECTIIPGQGLMKPESQSERIVTYFEGEDDILTPVSIRESSYVTPWKLAVRGSDHEQVLHHYERRRDALVEQAMVTYTPPPEDMPF